ncbi:MULTISPECIES: hypothetical protein [unclassified Sutcliffiella]|uniref:hypothetical protein n=1 Tax=unclassified Sutcliffiella TaxID=2837532 RepID=UPI0030D55C01
MEKLSSTEVFKILPSIGQIWKKAKIKQYIRDNKLTLEEDEDFRVLMMTSMLDVMMHVLTYADKIEKDVHKIVSIVQEKPLEEVATQNFSDNLETVIDVLSQDSVVGFFKKWMQ